MQLAFADKETQAIYLLTDGRPDQVLIKVGDKEGLTSVLKVNAENGFGDQNGLGELSVAVEKLLGDISLPRTEVRKYTEESLCFSPETLRRIYVTMNVIWLM